jgi:exopolysaccharide production protein ExoZ
LSQPAPTPTAPASHDERIDFVQALRGIAALAVVFYHSKELLNGGKWLDLGKRAFSGGAAGVDLFFVISGFIMVHTTWRSDGSPRSAARFVVKRLVRVWPVYVIWTLVYVALLYATPGWKGSFFDPANLWKLAKAFAFVPQRVTGAPFLDYQPLNVGWTLGYEVCFYLMFGLSLLARRWRWAALSGLFLIFLVAVPLVFRGVVNFDAYKGYAFQPALANLVTSPFMWEFAAGAAIGWLYRSRFGPRDRGLLTGFAAVAIGIVLWQLFTEYRTGHGITRWGPAMVLMVLALALYDKRYRIRVPAGLIWLGNVSFSLYLVHRVVQHPLPLFVTGKNEKVLVNGGPWFLMSTILAIVLAYASYRYLEQGLAERLRRRVLAKIGK